MGVAVVVEKVVYRQLSGINREARDILRTRDLVEAVVDKLPLATEPDRLLQKEPRDIKLGYMLSCLLGFAVGKAREA
jgi:hypothetical protein